MVQPMGCTVYGLHGERCSLDMVPPIGGTVYGLHGMWCHLNGTS